ncbi:hypothetical protein MJO28_007296 [Puccinia striiformis f. sp. tritici]|uniref:Uncharacterized protein n=1 Tax=Puccinia striiformis f. sp. tritici TaxID=168172 RepID=A0ACC0EGZ8_9BASI|nr:hypothetical protein MJO28_007296 [Puccinia striiformis f. sp. tritici]
MAVESASDHHQTLTVAVWPRLLTLIKLCSPGSWEIWSNLACKNPRRERLWLKILIKILTPLAHQPTHSPTKGHPTRMVFIAQSLLLLLLAASSLAITPNPDSTFGIGDPVKGHGRRDRQVIRRDGCQQVGCNPSESGGNPPPHQARRDEPKLK